MNFCANIFCLEQGEVLYGLHPKKRSGKFKSFLAVGNIRVDENNLYSDSCKLTQGYLCYFSWSGEYFWEFSSLLIASNFVESDINWAILILDDKHVLLEKGKPKVFQNLTFLYEGERSIKLL